MPVTSMEIKRALSEKHCKDFFLTEVKNGSTYFPPPGGLHILDGLAIKISWTAPCFTGYEIKVSRSDFLRDAKFFTYEALVNELYIVCPKGMIDRNELPDNIGLMYYDAESKKIITKKKATYRKVEYSADMLLYIIFYRLDSDRYPFCQDKQEYFRAYLANKKNNRQLAAQFRSKLLEENARLEAELEKMKRDAKDLSEIEPVLKVLSKHRILSIWGAENMAKELDKRLSRCCNFDLKDVLHEARYVANALEQMERAANQQTDTEVLK